MQPGTPALLSGAASNRVRALIASSRPADPVIADENMSLLFQVSEDSHMSLVNYI